MQLDFSNFSATQRYHLMTQSIIPRPIAWALTDSENGSYNLAPFSYFTAVSSDPALLMLSVGKKPNGENKDTLTNQTAATLAHGESELSNTNLTTSNFESFSLPRLTQCDLAFGCELYEIKEIGDVPQSLIFVEARLGGGEYASTSQPFTLQRPE